VRRQARLDPAEAVALYVRALRTRAGWLYALRAACGAIGAASVSVVLAAALCGPVVTPRFAAVALGVLTTLALGIFIAALWPLGRLRGHGGCGLLAAREPVLASRVRSALELQGSTASPALVAAHARAVRAAIADVPPAMVVPITWLRHPLAIAGLGATLLSALLLLGSESLQNGAHALINPAHVRPDGVRIGKVALSTTARLIYPSYLARSPAELREPEVIEAPRGTTVELLVHPRIPSRQGAALLGPTQVRMSAAPNGRLFARFVVRENAPLTLRLFSDDHWYEDDQPRRVLALEDQLPKAVLDLPEANGTVEAQASLGLRFKASDDHGLSSVDLVIRSPSGAEQRRRLWSTLRAEKPRTEVADETSLVPAEVGAQPGDGLLLWLEARDSDVVSGPNLGVSRSIHVEVATDAQKLSLRLPLLREVLDGALESLGDRLETPVPEQNGAAQQRFADVQASATAWTADLQRLIAAAHEQNEAHGLDLDQLQGILDRTRRELGREGAAYRGSGQTQRQHVEADGRVVAAHERDVLLLADILAQGLVDEARALTEELSELKTRVAELLKQLKAERSPEAERALLAEIAKISRRLRELGQSLARLANRVPSEFINREALPQDDAGNAVDKLRASVESGDLESAERQLEELAQGIDQLSSQIESGGARFREAHFGARDKAVAGARRDLDMLAAEQHRLAERTHGLVQRAAERAKSRGGQPANADMRGAADDLERDLRALQESEPSSPEASWLERARDRMRDVGDAMRTSDLAEARRMAAAAGNSLEQAAQSLDQDARMFPGHHGETWQRAEAASGAADKLRKLQKQIDQAMPQLGQFVGEPDRRQMHEDFEPQRRARRKTEALQADMQHGAEGAPLSPSGDRGLQAAADAMRRAERSLERGDPQGASLAQQDATEQLKQVEERLRQGGEPSGRKDGKSGRQDGSEGVRSDVPVRIPRADEFSGPVQMRRRLLDAMREPPPSEFKSAVKRYYEELLR
jgi:hypothetical protein